MSKNTFILGDSYSTFANYIPEGYAVYYSETGRPETDVRKVSETWWYPLAEEADLNIVLNNSWSGSPLCYTGYGNADCSHTSSFIYRLQKLIDEGFFEQNDIQTVFVFGATNDHWAGTPVGEIKFDHFEKSELYSVAPAICYLLKKLRSTLPQADIYCLINTDLNPGITEAFLKASDKYNITPITFDHIDKNGGHPTIKGMQDIKNRVLSVLKA